MTVLESITASTVIVTCNPGEGGKKVPDYLPCDSSAK